MQKPQKQRYDLHYDTDAQCGFLSGDKNVEFPPHMLGLSPFLCPTHPSICFLPPTGTGMQNTNFVLFVTASNTVSCNGGGLAYGVSCATEMFDRPAAARLNICPTQLDDSPLSMSTMKASILHETIHMLGFDANYFWRFRDVDTMAPLTPRAADGVSALTPQLFSCDGGFTTFSQTIPAQLTLYSYAERGLALCRSITDYANQCVHKLVGANTAAAVQWYFGCSTVQGAELENHEGGCQILGSHLESRMYSGHLMAPHITPGSVLDSIRIPLLWLYCTTAAGTYPFILLQLDLTRNNLDFNKDANLHWTSA